MVPDGGDPFFAEIQDVYDEIGEGLPPATRFLQPGELPDERAEIEASGLFENVTRSGISTGRSATTQMATSACSRPSPATSPCSDWQRDRLYGEIRRRLADRPDGRLRRHWGAVLHVARRRDPVA